MLAELFFSQAQKRTYFPRPLLRAGVGAASAFFARLAGFDFFSEFSGALRFAAAAAFLPASPAFCADGSQAVVRPPTVSNLITPIGELKVPDVWLRQRWWKSQPAGNFSACL